MKQSKLVLFGLVGKIQSFTWEPLPKGFDIRKPDTLLPLVRQTKYNWNRLPFDMIYIFGDSGCDTGRYAKTSRGWLVEDETAFWQGRFSNGPVWPDYFEAMNNIPVNSFCYAASVVDTKNFVLQPGIPDFEEQLNFFIKEQNTTAKNPLAMFGFVGNDLLNPNLSLDLLGDQIKSTLIKFSNVSKINNIFVINSPVESYHTKLYSKKLMEISQEIMQEHQEIDIYAANTIEQIIQMSRIPPPNAKPGSWIVPACYDPSTKIMCDDPENHFLVDSFHFTTVPNYYLAARISRLISGYWNN